MLQTIILRVSVLILFLFIDSVALLFSHPGALHSKAELDFIKSQILLGAQPWTGEYNRMLATAYATATPRGMIFVLSTNNNQANTIRDDAFAAYTQALLWYFSDNNVYADRAVAILNSWAVLQGFVSGSDQDKLLAGWTGALFAPAAEIMRLYPAWSANSISSLQAMFRRAFYPQLNSMSTWNGNADLTQIDAMISIAVFNEDESEFNLNLVRMNSRIPAYFYLSSAGPVPSIAGDGGNINQFWSNPAQWVDGLTQETCRDYGHHVQFALGSVLHAMETAWHQGVDAYTPNQDRMVAAMELQARCFLVGSMLGLCSPWPITPSTDRYDTWEIGYNHYRNRKGVPLPNTLKLIMTQIRPNAFRDSRGWNIAYETLTHGNLTDSFALPSVNPTVAPSAVISVLPTVVPTRKPSSTPSKSPSSNPTSVSSFSPTGMPTGSPSIPPTKQPTAGPTLVSSSYPTLFPSSYPSYVPTQPPLCASTLLPSNLPSPPPTQYSNSNAPSPFPSTENPQALPSSSPTGSPTSGVSNPPADDKAPSFAPTGMPIVNPSSLLSSSFSTSLPSSYPSSFLTESPLSDSGSETPSTSIHLSSLLPSPSPEKPQLLPSSSPTVLSTSERSSVPAFAPTSISPTLQTTSYSTLLVPSSSPNSPVPTSMFLSPYPTGDLLSLQPTRSFPEASLSATPTPTATSTLTQAPSSCNPSKSPTTTPTLVRRPSTSPSLSPRAQSKPAAIPTGAPSRSPTTLPSASSNSYLYLQFSQSLSLSLSTGCSAISATQSSQEALEVTTADSLQVSSSYVHYTSCSNSGGTAEGKKNLLLLAGTQPFSSVVQLSVLLPLPRNDNNATAVYAGLQSNMRAAVSSGNATRRLLAASRLLNATATFSAATTAVLAASASSPSLVLPPSSPTTAPSTGAVGDISLGEQNSDAPSTIIIIAIAVGGMLGITCALYYLMYHNKCTFCNSSIDATTQPDKMHSISSSSSDGRTTADFVFVSVEMNSSKNKIDNNSKDECVDHSGSSTFCEIYDRKAHRRI